VKFSAMEARAPRRGVARTGDTESLKVFLGLSHAARLGGFSLPAADGR
jgi:hypothetical protein